jgi:hypothetical protein
MIHEVVAISFSFNSDEQPSVHITSRIKLNAVNGDVLTDYLAANYLCDF